MGGNRSRIARRVATTAGQGETINYSWVVPWNGTLIQAVITFSSPPKTLGSNLIISRVNADNRYSYRVYNDDPAITGALYEFVLTGRFEFSHSDLLTISYANPDNQSVGVECTFEEAQ